MAKKKGGKGKKAHYIRPSRTDAGFCSVSDTFYSETIEVEVLQRAYYIRK